MINTKKLLSYVEYATEIAKIELSSDEFSKVEVDSKIFDEDGEEIYLDVEISREQYDKLIDEMIMKTIETTRETIDKAGLMPKDIDKIIFIGRFMKTIEKNKGNRACFELRTKRKTIAT